MSPIHIINKRSCILQTQPARRKAAYLAACGRRQPDCKYNKDKKKGMRGIMNRGTLSEMEIFYSWTLTARVEFVIIQAEKIMIKSFNRKSSPATKDSHYK